MHHNLLFKILLMIVLIASFWTSGEALYKLYLYYKLDGAAKIDQIEWSIVEKSSDQYQLFAKYQFQSEGKIYQGSSEDQSETFLNEWAAKKASLERFPRYLFYSKAHPEYTSLQRIYPLKELIYSAVLWCLFAYFLFLGYYVAQENKRMIQDG